MNTFINIFIGLSLFLGLILAVVNPAGGVLLGGGFAIVLYQAKKMLTLKKKDPENYAKNVKNEKNNRVLIGIAMIIIGFVLLEPEKKSDQDSLSNIKPKSYQVVAKRDLSFAGRKRLEWVIVAPDAKTKLDRAATAKAAARELQQTQKANVAYIILEQSKATWGQGNAYAIVNYYPDGCGNSGEDCNEVKWEVEASDYLPTEVEINTWELWTISRDGFAGDDKVLDLDEEKILTKAIAERLGIDEQKVKLPYITRERI